MSEKQGSDTEMEEQVEETLLKIPQSSGDDEDDDDDEDDESSGESQDDEDELDEADRKLMRSYIETLGRIDKNKYSYEDYVALVNIAHEISDLDKIRESCELFASVYPLAPEIWLKWLRIELNIATTETEYKKVHQLFRRALADYYSTTVALEYANLAVKSPKAYETWEVLISTYTLHCMEGRALFEAWRTYCLKEEEDGPEKYAKLVQTYEQELSIPLNDMEETYIELKVLCEKEKDKYVVDWPQLDAKYNKAKDQLQKIMPFEKRLADLDAKEHQKRATVYMEYISKGKEYLNDQIVQVLYERMVTDCCLNARCWLEYMRYIQSRNGFNTTTNNTEQQSLVFSQTDWDVCNRAIRNCTWSAEIYIEKMRIAEKMELSKQDVQGVAEFALAAGFQTPEPVVNIWLEYLSYLRRNVNFKCEKEVEIMRATFSLAWDTLGRQFGVLADCNCEILQMWGRLEYGPLNDLAKGKELWTTVMDSADNASKTGLWIEFAHLELRKGVDGARKVYRKALSTPDLDDLSVITSAWIRFERCNGTLEQLKTCQQQCDERLVRQQVQNTYARNSFEAVPKGGGKASLKRKTFDRPEKKFGGKADGGDGGGPVAAKKPRGSGAERAERSVITKNNISSMGPPEEKREKLDNLAEMHDAQQVDTSNDNVTIFISNLAYNTKEEDIVMAFSELNIKSVNIIKSANGNSRGFGYVHLATMGDVEKSLTFDRRLINGRPTFVSSVSRDKEQRKKVFKYSESMEPTKLFVKGLSFETTKDELEILFGEFGALKEVRMVFHKNGSPKGIAYVDYENEKAASKAIMKLDGMMLKNFKISVAISAPPPKPQMRGAGAVNPLLTLGQGRRTPGVRGEAKPRMSFIPRSVVQKAGGGKLAEGNGAAGPEPIAAPKTNDDFRKLLSQ